MPETVAARAIIVDPCPFFREGLSSCLSRGGYLTLYQGRNLAEVLPHLGALQPDLALVGPNLTEHESLAVCRELRKRWPSIKLIVFSMDADDPLFQADAADAGAAACLLPTIGDEECLTKIAAVMAGYQLFPRDIQSPIFQPEKLTAKELEVLKLMAEDKTDPQIAAALVRDVSTVHSHRQHILEKLGVNDRKEAVRRARRRGLV